MKKSQNQDPQSRPLEEELEELNAYAEKGILLSLRGKPSNPAKIVKAYCIAESAGTYTYMRDYLPDQSGRIQRINFNKIKIK